MNPKTSLGDRYAEIAVIAVTLVALLAGWLYMDSVESRSVQVTGEISASVPAGWIQSEPEGDLLVQVRDRNSLGFQTTYAVTKMPLNPDGGQNEAVSLITLARGQDLTAYRVLDQRSVSVGGREAYEVTYAYVEANPNLTRADVPVVVLGVDYIFFDSEGAVIVSYRAAEPEYKDGLARFYRFLESIQF